MAFDRDGIRTSVLSKLKNDSRFLTDDDVTNQIDDALIQLNRDRPDTLKVDITGDGTQDYALPATFKRGFSILRTVEFPAGEKIPRIIRENDDWDFYEDPSKTPTQRLRFFSVTPTASDTIRIEIETPWLIEAADTTLDQNSFIAMVYKTLEFSFRALAAKMADSTDNSIDANTVDRGALGSNFLFLAERYKTDYKRVTGLDQKVRAAQGFGDPDVIFSHGEDFFWHPARTR